MNGEPGIRGSQGFAPCVVIPVYNHERFIGPVLGRVVATGLKCIVVDDGSDVACRDRLQDLVAEHPDAVQLVRHETNRGKGAAVTTGIRQAARAGYSHVLQIDGDGQHRSADIPVFVATARQAPEAVVVGRPVFDTSIPQGRKLARYLTHVWVWINTLSLDIQDAMCGFRVYPVAPVVSLMEQVELGERMDFDIEILVRLHWSGARVINLPTEVIYPDDRVSHFRMLQDNLRISCMHTRLFFGMLKRLPGMLLRRLSHS